MASSTDTSPSNAHGWKRAALWAVAVACVVVGLAFLAVALTNGGDTQTGGFMVALPALALVGLCVWGLRRP